MSEYLKIAREVMRDREAASEGEATLPMEAAIKGRALELWSDVSGERFWLVADEEDAVLLGGPRGSIYTAAEARCVVQIADPTVIAEVLTWKREFNGTIGALELRRRQ